MALDSATLKRHVRDIPDWPRPGITFRDITPLLARAESFHAIVDALADHFAVGIADAGGRPVDVVLGVEARGFILAAPVAHRLGAGFVPVRKGGKLPHRIEQEEYELEYGTDLLEVHKDAITVGQRVLVIDDVIATGGTAAATVRLVRKLGGELAGIGCLLELASLRGREQLPGCEVFSLVIYDDEEG